MKSKVLLIDGNSLFHRAYHALPSLTDKNGEVANAVFGFSNMILKAINEVKPTHVACAFDTQAPTFRHIEFEAYKAQRPPPPPDLYPQLPKVKKILEVSGIAYFEKEGYEADDILATLVSRVVYSSQSTPLRQGYAGRAVHRKKKTVNREPKTVNEVIILSGDRDCLQLVDDDVKVQMPGWNLKETTLYGPAEVKVKYGLEPNQMVDFKSLTGDPSDNVPGIAGIGPKTAASLLQKFKTLENLFKKINQVGEPLRSKLKAGCGVALAAKKLVELDRNINLKFKIENLKFEPNWDQVRQVFEDLGFKSIVAKIPRGQKESESQNERSKLKKNSDQLELI